MTTVTYEIHLEEPAIFAKIDGDPNAAVSYPYIPGSAVRGMLIGRFIRGERQKDSSFELDAAGKNNELFFSPETRYLNAYPLINKRRSLPVPATWSIPRYLSQDELNGSEKIHITDSTLDVTQPDDKDEPAAKDRRKAKSLSGFTVLDDDTAHIYEPDMALNVHNARARRSASEQQVYRYEALAGRQVFKGAILCKNDTHASTVLNLLKTEEFAVMGGARTAGYGRVRLTNVKKKPGWQEVEHTTQLLNQSTISLTFLSDALIFNEFNRSDPTPQTLIRCLRQHKIVCNVLPVNLKMTIAGGFNRKWGLPLPQMPGIAAGSVVMLEFDSDDRPYKQALEKLILEGIGERREDGFGRIAPGWLPVQSINYSEYTGTERDTVELDEEASTIWAFIESRIQPHELDEAIGTIFTDNAYVIRGDISRTQLSRLRVQIANLLRDVESEQKWQETIGNFLDHIEGKVSERQFKNARIRGKSLWNWLQSPDFPTITDHESLSTLKLVDAVLERAYRDRAGTSNKEEV